MKQQKIFKCPLTKYTIEYIVDTDKKNAYMGILLTDFKELKPLFALIRSSIDELEQQGISKITQTVSKNDWMLYLKDKTTWKLIKEDMGRYECDIECDIKSFLENFGIGIGLLQ
ncbi:hypothetical protein QKU48_gp0227 [Fadolivirus algeromassiliense]|jgi:hypothetical protein|uniref:Uncharacterized protein n=1 Tax=Fadolivirus FV1/VV64 TaxID=3070911 RepID=A0A7D3QTX6_9VIRU|nr:hypothetical protein QKU48_gp0227 [Fadolivirus algeromassiliense]QKF93685.1 hypothetical protein Fadolivirus_1_227 [Fadolivirus FV1/VV64]